MQECENNTYQEIISQPDVWLKTLQDLNADFAGDFISEQEFDQVIITGCGSTYYLSIWGARSIQERTGWVCRPLPASELWLNPGIWLDNNKRTLLIAVSRSGTTSETIIALRKFKKTGNGVSVVVTCYPESTLAQLADKLIAVPHAQEKSIAQTRSFSNMMLGLSSLVDKEIPEKSQRLVASRQKKLFEDHHQLMTDLGKDLALERLFFLGSGSKYGLACEVMLKMKEMSLTYSEAYHTLEFRHGPMSMVNENSLVVGILGKSNIQYEMEVLSEMKKLGARVLVLGNLEAFGVPDWLDHYIQIDLEGLEMFGDVLYLPMLQLLAYERSMANGYNPDKPNNLTAVVTLDEPNE